MTSYLRWNPVSCLRAAAAALFVLLFSSLNVFAQTGPKKDFAIEAGDAASTLKQFAQQSGAELLYSADVVEGVRTHAVKGEFTPKDALELMVADTALVVSQGRTTGGLAVRRATEAEAKNVERAIVEKSVRPEKSGKTELDEKGEPVVKLDTFEVFGRKTLNMDIRRTADDIQPYVVFTQHEISQSGSANLEEFLTRRVTSMTTFISNSQRSDAVGNLSSLSMRGLGTNETLILIDGRRALGTPGVTGIPSQPDLNAIPTSAIERIEVLSTTASGIYGGSATGGVINIVMRRDYRGGEIKLTYANTFEADAGVRRIDFSVGATSKSGATHAMLVASYSEANELWSQDRGYWQRGIAASFRNSPASVFSPSTVPLGYTTNIASASVLNFATFTFTQPILTLKGSGQSLNSVFTYIPAGYTGVGADGGAALITNAGSYSIVPADTAQFGGRRRGLMQAPRTLSANLTVQHEINDRWNAYLEASYMRNQSSSRVNNAAGSFTIPGSAAVNPFNEDVTVTTPIFGADDYVSAALRGGRVVVGLIGKLPHEWKGNLDYTLDENAFSNRTPGLFDTARATTALSNGTINAFRDTNAQGLDFSSFVLAPWELHSVRSRAQLFSARVGGPTVDLPGGPLSLSMAMEHRSEKFGEASINRQFSSAVTQRTVTPERGQTVSSLYIEGLLPLVAARSGVPFVQSLDLQMAVRGDSYSVDGTNKLVYNNGATTDVITRVKNKTESLNPTLGLRYRPTTDISFRASFGTGFLPPSVNQLVPGAPSPVQPFISSFLGLRDPLRGNSLVGGFVNQVGGNTQLKPEKSKSASAGVVYSPATMPKLRLSLDWTRIEKKENIASLTATNPEHLRQLILFAPERIKRGPIPTGDTYSLGPITEVDTTLINLAEAMIETFDFGLNYGWTAPGWGKLDLRAAATLMGHNRTKLSAGATEVENAAVGGNTRWRAVTTLDWARGPFRATWVTRYYAGYWLTTDHAVNARQGSAQVSSQTYHDLTVTAQLGALSRLSDHRWLTGVELSVGATNLFNHRAPLDVTNAGFEFYSPLGDPRGARYSVSLKKVF